MALAYNEANLIGSMLSSLMRQTLFHDFSPETSRSKASLTRQAVCNTMNIEIVVIPNGCTDNTAEIAREVLEKSVDPINKPNIHWKVCEVEQPGKSNAWNVYVHSLSATDAQYLFLMDADIEFLEPKTLEAMIAVLESQSEVWVTVDKPIKDVKLKSNKNFMEMLSLSIAGLSGNRAVEGEATWICGQLYCARSDILRQIWLPTALPTQDAFLYDMITTEGLTLPRNSGRVILSPTASHVFESYIGVRRLLRHERWLITGTAINKMLYFDLTPHARNLAETGLLIKQRNEQNAAWLNLLVQEMSQKSGWWLIPKRILARRFKSMSDKSLPQLIVLLPLAILAFMVDLILAVQANSELHRGKAMGYWGKSSH
ncbi:MAG: glycosyltransferase family 2 protein [Microcoleaceae cyanobacterium]